MASSMTVKFLTPLSMGARISFKLGNTELFFNVVSERFYSNEMQYSTTATGAASNYKNVLTADYSTTVTATVGGDTVNIVSNSSIANFSSGTVIGGGTVSFTYNNTVVGNITVDGLSSNNYLINNDIIVRLRYTAMLGGYFRIQLQNQTTNKSTNYITAQQGGDGTAIINLATLVKGIFSYPKMKIGIAIFGGSMHNGCDTIKINISYINGAGQIDYTTTKRFIRGGKRTDQTNQTQPLGYLMPAPKLPVWSGRETTVSSLTNDGIFIIPNSEIDVAIKVAMKTKGCDNTYVKFLNQKAGYSYWQFENYNLSETNTSLGSYVRVGAGVDNFVETINAVKTGFQDLGNTSSNTISLTSKVPAEFLPYMNDLIVSPDIYFFDTRLASGSSAGAWHHATSSRNTITPESNRKAYNVKITLDIDNRFNPSLLW